MRDDPVSVNHRITALLASYFDILFAVNRLYHPGEKRLIPHVLANCTKRPPDFPKQLRALFAESFSVDQDGLLARVNDLLDGLDDLLLKH